MVRKEMQSSYSFMFLTMVTLVTAILSRGVEGVDYTVTNNAASTSGGTVFANEIGEDHARQTMSSATDFIWQIFQQTTDADRKSVDQVSLTIVPNLPSNAVAQVSNNQIEYSAKSITSSANVKTDFDGVIYHEMTHVWQWNGNNQANPGLIEGIADFVRLKADYIVTNWVQPGGGDRWDAGYSITARFLDYCESLMGGFVAELNKKMRDGYSDSFFEDLLGRSVDQLWSDYKAKYGN